MEEYRKVGMRDVERNERSKYLSMVSAERSNLKDEYDRKIAEMRGRHKSQLEAAERAQVRIFSFSLFFLFLFFFFFSFSFFLLIYYLQKEKNKNYFFYSLFLLLLLLFLSLFLLQRELDRVAYDQRQRHLEAMRKCADLETELRRKEEVERRATEIERRYVFYS